MKMVGYYESDDEYEEQCYIAYYRDEPYVVGYHKKYVKIYMERYRKLSPEEYIIMEDELTSSKLREYEEIMLCEFEGLYLPERDIEMIQTFCHNIPERIENLCRELYLFGGMIGQIKGTGKEIDLILKTYRTIAKYHSDEEKLREMQKVDHLDNPIIYCNMNEYRKFLSKYQEYHDNYERYLDKIWDEI